MAPELVSSRELKGVGAGEGVAIAPARAAPARASAPSSCASTLQLSQSVQRPSAAVAELSSQEALRSRSAAPVAYIRLARAFDHASVAIRRST